MDAMGIIFSNIHDEDLRELTESRTFASVPFGGRYRLVDFVLSNMVNSGISNVGIVVKSRYLSLMDHLGTGKEWDLSRKRGGLFIFPPYARTSDAGIYKGRLDALAGVRTYLRRSMERYIILADSNVICSMDFRDVIDTHISRNADVTLVYNRACEGACNRTSTLSRRVCYEFDISNRLVDVVINPPLCEQQNVGLDIVVMEREFLLHAVEDAAARGYVSLTKDFLQRNHSKYRIFGYEYSDYFTRIDSINTFFSANMDLLKPEVRHALFYRHGDVYTKVRDQVPAKYGSEADVSNSLVADGCVVEGQVTNSILFRGVHIGKGTKVRDSIVMQGSSIADKADLSYIIADKDVVIHSGRRLAGYESYPVVLRKGSSI